MSETSIYSSVTKNNPNNSRLIEPIYSEALKNKPQITIRLGSYGSPVYYNKNDDEKTSRANQIYDESIYYDRLNENTESKASKRNKVIAVVTILALLAIVLLTYKYLSKNG
jgi:hypothetical protein